MSSRLHFPPPRPLTSARACHTALRPHTAFLFLCLLVLSALHPFTLSALPNTSPSSTPQPSTPQPPIPPPSGFQNFSASELPLADPFILHHEGTYYAYGTGYRRGFHVHTSTDLRTWKQHPTPALDKADSYGENKFWAPEVVYRPETKTFHMYYTAQEHLCVATAKSPLGPFKQSVKQPMRPERAIDSTLFVDTDGAAYLYYVVVANGQNIIWGAELEPDWLAFKPNAKPFLCIRPEHPWELIQGRVTEGPSVIKHDNTYYLLYSANHYLNQSYAVGYATSASPRGPWKKSPSNPILRLPPNGLVGTGHGAPFRDKTGAYHYVFHAHSSAQSVHPRKMYIAPLRIKNSAITIDQLAIITPRAPSR